MYKYNRMSLGNISLFCFVFLKYQPWFASNLGLWAIYALVSGQPSSVRHELSLEEEASSENRHKVVTPTVVCCHCSSTSCSHDTFLSKLLWPGLFSHFSFCSLQSTIMHVRDQHLSVKTPCSHQFYLSMFAVLLWLLIAITRIIQQDHSHRFNEVLAYYVSILAFNYPPISVVSSYSLSIHPISPTIHPVFPLTIVPSWPQSTHKIYSIMPSTGDPYVCFRFVQVDKLFHFG